MIVTVFTKTLIYTSSSKEATNINSKKTVLHNCTFKQTAYGSVIIDRPTHPTIIELYPNSIKHIIHSK